MKVNKILENLRRKISSQKQQSNGSLEKDKETKKKDGAKDKKETIGMGNGEDKTPKGNGYSEKDLLEDMPTLREVIDPEKKRMLLIKKIDLCAIIFDFTKANNEKSHHLARNNKRQYLIELVEHAGQSKQWYSEEVMPHAVEMLSVNLFRALPPPMYADFDPEEDEPNFDPAWPHVQFVYEFFHKFVMTTDVKLLSKYMTKEFLAHTVDLFNSEDPREREYVKMILHRIYGRCMKFRCFIRRTIHHALLLVIYDNARHNGISELLEILGSIINGFAVPLKQEHVYFLRQVLIPLHKIPTLSQFHQQLAYCVTQFIQKDASLAGDVLSGILRFWPVKSCQKEILFLSELEEVLELTATPQIESVIEPLFRRIACTISSDHFQVAERALFLWNNDIIATFTSDHRNQILPIIFPALQRNYSKHWNTTVSTLTLNIIRIFKDMDKELYEEISKKFKGQRNGPEHKAKMRAEKWKQLLEQSVVA